MAYIAVFTCRPFAPPPAWLRILKRPPGCFDLKNEVIYKKNYTVLYADTVKIKDLMRFEDDLDCKTTCLNHHYFDKSWWGLHQRHSLLQLLYNYTRLSIVKSNIVSQSKGNKIKRNENSFMSNTTLIIIYEELFVTL